ncbi:opsin-5 isoform X2 [Eleutherodactylus coqui]|uniref:opsin-5 isoform X2 n=1 Tax=Eleutherodactylus coqui TaxID=57060 RepID=UPI0034629849
MATNRSFYGREGLFPLFERGEDVFESKLSKEADIIAGLYLLIIGVLSTFGNGYVICMACRRKKKLRPAELMTINLAISDLGISVAGKPFAIVSFFSHRWVFGWSVCQWYGWTGFFFGCGSLITMTVVSCDRYLKICHMKYGTWLKRRHAFLSLFFVWVYAAFWATLPVVGVGNYAPEPFGTSCTLDWWLAQASLKGKVFVVAMLICAGFLIAWIPYAIVSFWSAFGRPDSVPIELSVIPTLLAKSAAMYNPIIYQVIDCKFSCCRPGKSLQKSNSRIYTISTYRRSVPSMEEIGGKGEQ